jgi:AcrR family transcriptional regulator
MPSKSERTRQFIIEKAAPVFNTRGYAATSMSDIMEVTGLAKGGLYGHFESKDELAKESLKYCFDLLQLAIRERIRQKVTARDKLTEILHFYKNYSTHPVIEGGCPLLNAAIDADDQWPILRDIALKFMRESVTALSHIIQQGIEHKEFNASIHAQEEAENIFATIEGGIMMSKLSGSPKILNRILDRIYQTVIHDFSI